MDDGRLTIENADFGKDYLPIWCETCNQQVFIFEEDINQPAFVICTRCGDETSQVWCPKCGMGGDYIRNIKNRPMSWVCTKCHTKYKLPEAFYENPVHLYLEIELPPDVFKRIHTLVSSYDPYYIDPKLYIFLGVWIIVPVIALFFFHNLLICTLYPLLFPTGIVLVFKYKKHQKTKKNNR